MHKFQLALAAVLLCGFHNIASANFVGHVMEAHVYVPPSPFYGPGGVYSSKVFEVNDGIEAPLFGVLNESAIDVSGNNILIDFVKSSVYFTSGVYVFSDRNSTIEAFVDVTLSSLTTNFYTSWGSSVAFDPSRISFDADNVYVDLSGLGVRADSQLSLDVKFASVPEPSTAILFSGLLIPLFGGRWLTAKFNIT